jgi:predicted nucleic acid-binding protein
MTHGLDTGFLVAAEVQEHAEHVAARNRLTGLVAAGDLIAIAPQVLAEFIHIVTDPRRFKQPLDMMSAIDFSRRWWTAREVVPVFPGDDATRQFLVGCSSTASAESGSSTRYLQPPTTMPGSNLC